MDLNLSGGLAANISLIQESASQHSAYDVQIITTLLTAVVTLGAVGLTHFLTARFEERKRHLNEKEKWLENRKNAYMNFMDVYSTPITLDRYEEEFHAITKEHLDAALSVIEFGDESINPLILLKLSGEDKNVGSLNDLIKFVLNIRCRADLRLIERIEIFQLLRIEAVDRFGSSFLDKITPR